MPPPLRKPTPRVILKRERQREVARVARTVRAAVWRRDQGRCRACARRRGHDVHHLQRRSQGGPWTTANCLVLCRRCHQDVHAGVLRIAGTDANGAETLTFDWQAWW